MDTRQRGFVEPLSAHAFDPPGVRLSRPERADIETIGLERDDEGRIVDLRGRGSKGRWRCSGRAAPRPAPRPATWRQRAFRGKRSGVAKAVRGSMIETSRPAIRGDRRQRLRDVHGPDEGEARRRRLDCQKIVLALMRDRRALAHAQRRLQFRRERVGVDRFGANEALVAVRKTGDDGAPRAAPPRAGSSP